MKHLKGRGDEAGKAQTGRFADLGRRAAMREADRHPFDGVLPTGPAGRGVGRAPRRRIAGDELPALHGYRRFRGGTRIDLLLAMDRGAPDK